MSNDRQLTAKEKLFVDNIVYKGMNYSNAYRNAYNTANMATSTVNEKASRLKDKLRASIDKAREEADSPKIISVVRRKEKLSEIINTSEDIHEQMKAMDLLNKMEGVYVTKVDGGISLATKIEDLI